MIGDKKTYVIPERNWLRCAAAGQWVGSTFRDHGKTMEIEEVGEAYETGRERFVDIEAVEIAVSSAPAICK